MFEKNGKKAFHRSRGVVWLAVVLSAAAVILGGVYYVFRTYTVKNVYVEGNLHYTQEEIRDIVTEGPLGGNSLYLAFKYRNKGVENIPFVDVMDVSILSPDTIKITVYEKALAGFVKYLDSYMYFDKDGYVVECSDIKTAGIPQISGLEFNHVVLGDILPVEDAEVFNHIMNITKLLNKYVLTADKIYFHSSGEITIYFGEVKVALGGSTGKLEEKIMILPELLGKLTGEKGTLRMENYSEDHSNVTFEPDAK